MITLSIIPSSDLTQQDIIQIHKIWEKAFDIDIINDRPSLDKLFFLTKDQDKIVSLGCLKPIRITFQDQTHDIQGIGGIASKVKHKGYGTKTITAIHKYLISHDYTGIGFCSNSTAPFYQQAGYTTIPKLIHQFKSLVPPQPQDIPDQDDHVIYLKGQDSLIELMQQNPHHLAKIPDYW